MIKIVIYKNIECIFKIMSLNYIISILFILFMSSILIIYDFDWLWIKNDYKLTVTFLIKKLVSILSKSESVKFSLIELAICLFTDSSVNKYFSLLNQLIFTEIISEIWLIYSNLFLAIWISQISLIISRFWLIQI